LLLLLLLLLLLSKVSLLSFVAVVIDHRVATLPREHMRNDPSLRPNTFMMLPPGGLLRVKEGMESKSRSNGETAAISFDKDDDDDDDDEEFVVLKWIRLLGIAIGACAVVSLVVSLSRSLFLIKLIFLHN